MSDSSDSGVFIEETPTSPSTTTSSRHLQLPLPPRTPSSAGMSGSTTTTASSTTTAPINGGIDTLGVERIPWTGGPRVTLNTRPPSTKAYRPSDYKSKRKCEEDCTEGTGKKLQLKTPDEIIKDADAVLFVDWIDQL
jgi:hypothetical protein